MKELDIQEALKLADELEALHQYVPSEAPAMIRRLVEELDKQVKPIGVYDGKNVHIYTPQVKQGEPIAWMSPDGKVSQTEGKLFHIPLYTKPQQWHMVNKDGYVKPLSDEEIINIWLPFATYGIKGKIEFARAIEERHGIK